MGADVCKHGPKSGGPERVFIFMSVHALPLFDFSCVTKCMGRRNLVRRCAWAELEWCNYSRTLPILPSFPYLRAIFVQSRIPFMSPTQTDWWTFNVPLSTVSLAMCGFVHVQRSSYHFIVVARVSHQYGVAKPLHA